MSARRARGATRNAAAVSVSSNQFGMMSEYVKRSDLIMRDATQTARQGGRQQLVAVQPLAIFPRRIIKAVSRSVFPSYINVFLITPRITSKSLQ